jgi:hypothetical protein
MQDIIDLAQMDKTFRVPHPRRVVVFAARMGMGKSPLKGPDQQYAK